MYVGFKTKKVTDCKLSKALNCISVKTLVSERSAQTVRLVEVDGAVLTVEIVVHIDVQVSRIAGVGGAGKRAREGLAKGKHTRW